MAKSESMSPVIAYGCFTWLLCIIVGFVVDSLIVYLYEIDEPFIFPLATVAAIIFGWLPSLFVAEWKFRHDRK